MDYKGINDPVVGKMLDSLVECAGKARGEASPVRSGYHVGAAALWNDATHSRGWNAEYGGRLSAKSDGRGIHAEDVAIVSAPKDARRSGLRYLAVLAGNDDAPRAPCGNCRDVVKTYSDANTRVIVRAEAENLLLSLDDLLPAPTLLVDTKGLCAEDARILSSDYPSYLPRGASDDERSFAVGRIGQDDLKGFRMDDPAYHPVSAVASLLAQAGENRLDSLWIFTTGGYLCGNDCQYIFNHAEKHGTTHSLPVYICRVTRFAKPAKRLLCATPAELLPHAFSLCAAK